MEADELNRTRRSLHAVAELVLAGPQHRACGEIRLRITASGFSTVGAPDLRVEGDHLVSSSARFRLAGGTYQTLGAAAGVVAAAPDGVYPTGSGVEPGELISLDEEAAHTILGAFADGDRALRRFAPDEEPVLWPEHFDVAVTIGGVNYGVSPGDGYLPEPYAYVGPHSPRAGEFWDAPFGATRLVRDLAGPEEIFVFFREGARQAGEPGS